MPAENAAVLICESASEAGRALRELRAAGFGTGTVSVAARDPGGATACYYRAGNAIRCAGASGEFWNPAWEVLPGMAILRSAENGGLLVAGRLAEWVVAALEHAAIFSGLSALGAALYSIGIPREAVAEYETALAGGKYLVVAHGPAGEVARARRLLRPDGLG